MAIDKVISLDFGVKLRSIVKNASLTAFGILFMSIMSFINNIILTRNLGVDNYGLFVLVTNIITFIIIIPGFGFGSTIIRFVSFYKGKKAERNVKGVVLFALKRLIIFSIIVAVLIYFLSPIVAENLFQRQEIIPYLKILSFSIPFAILSLIFFSALNGLKLIKYQVIGANILIPIIFFSLIITSFWYGMELKGLIWIILIMSIISSIIGYYYIKTKYFNLYRNIKPIVDGKKLFHFAYPIYINEFLDSGIRYGIIFLIGIFLSNIDIGIYNVSFKIALLVSVFLGVFRLIFSPTISELFAQNNIPLISQLFKTITKWIFTISLLTFSLIVLYAKSILLMFGPDFASQDGILVLIILALGELINAGVGLSGIMILMSGRSKVILFNSVFNFVIISFLGYYLIQEYGVLGAAASHSISVIVLNLLRLGELYYFEKIQPYKWSYLKPILAVFLASSLTYYNLNYIVVNNTWTLIMSFILFLLSFVVVLTLLGFDMEDKYIIKQIFNKYKLNYDNK